MIDLEIVAAIFKHAKELGPEAQPWVVNLSALYMIRVASRLSISIKELNEKIAKVIDRVDSHEKRLTVIETQAKQSP